MLELKDICKTFNPNTINAKVALNHLNLTLNDGDFVTVIGGNGAGKSTMLNAIAGVFQVNNLTTLMITHNMKDAIAHGNRLIMMDAGRVVVDISGEDKKKLTVPDLLALFSRASGSDEANDKMLLS